MYYENDSNDSDTIILYDTDDTESVTSIAYSEEIQIYEDDIEFIEDENTQSAFDDISNSLYLSQPIRHGKIYIGTYKYIKRTRQYLYVMNIPLVSFLKYDSYLLTKYLYWHSSFYLAENPPIQLIEIYETTVDGTANAPVVAYCVIKTFWIKIIQRVWRRVFRERQRIIYGRSSLKSIQYRELHGCFPLEYRYMPRFSLFSR
jgi:hypothetical protein